jgi:hypothetical protein
MSIKSGHPKTFRILTGRYFYSKIAKNVIDAQKNDNKG